MYEKRSERSKVTDRFIKMKNQDSIHVAIRLVTFMEFQNTSISPEEFWTRFENYLSEKESLQPLLPLTLTDRGITITKESLKEKLDNGYNI